MAPFSDKAESRDKRIFQLKNSITTLVYGDGIGVARKLSPALIRLHNMESNARLPQRLLQLSDTVTVTLRDGKFDRVFIGRCRGARARANAVSLYPPLPVTNFLHLTEYAKTASRSIPRNVTSHLSRIFTVLNNTYSGIEDKSGIEMEIYFNEMIKS